MLRTVVTAAAVAIVTTAQAQAQAQAPQWTPIAEAGIAGASVAYIDRSSVTDLSDNKTVWVLRNHAETMNLGLDPVTGAPWYPHRSVKVMYSVDCSVGQVALSAWQMHSGNFANGEVVWADKHYGLPAYSAPAAAEESAAVVAACGAKTALR